MKLVGADAAETAELASLMGEALDSKRNARERIIRAIRLSNPEAARALQVQVPVATCTQPNDAPSEPLSDFLLERLNRAESCTRGAECECADDLDAMFCDRP